jgi:hypothetical protein
MHFILTLCSKLQPSRYLYAWSLAFSSPFTAKAADVTTPPYNHPGMATSPTTGKGTAIPVNWPWRLKGL